MPDDRCFRLNEDDIDELREHERDQQLVKAYARWVEHFAPRLDGIVAQITEAFSGVALGDGTGLFEAQGIDDYASDEERRELRVNDEKQDWRRISRDNLARCYSSPSFFDAQGFVFHLPAFLIAELDDKHPYGFIGRLIRTDRDSQWPKLLTAPQRKAVISTLKLVAEHPEFEDDRESIDATIQFFETGE